MTAGVPFDRVRALVRVKRDDLLRPELWKRSQADDPGGIPLFLQAPAVDASLRYTAAAPDVAGAVRRAAARVRANPLLCRLSWHLYSLFFRRGDLHFYKFGVETPSLGGESGLLPLLPLLGGVPGMQAIHRARRIPRVVVTDTLKDITIWARNFNKRHGHWGFDEIGWMHNHFNGRIYRLGRLQFMMAEFEGRVHRFRHRRTGATVLLSAPGVIYRADGRVDGTNGVKDPRQRWTATLSRRSGAVRGHPMTGNARALAEPVTLARREWQETLRPGDPVLDVHIPAGVPLDDAAAVASANRAPAFFRSRFPAHRARAIVCESWLLDPAFLEALPPTANVLRFVLRFHLYPRRGNGDGSLWSIFGRRPRDLARAARDTSFRRNIVNFHRGGGRLLGWSGGIWKDHPG